MIENPHIICLSEREANGRSLLSFFLATYVGDENKFFHIHSLELLLKIKGIDVSAVLNENYNPIPPGGNFFGWISCMLSKKKFNESERSNILQIIPLLLPFLDHVQREELRSLAKFPQFNHLVTQLLGKSQPEPKPHREIEVIETVANDLYHSLIKHIEDHHWAEAAEILLNIKHDTRIFISHLQLVIEQKIIIPACEMNAWEKLMDVLISKDVMQQVLENRYQNRLITMMMAKVHQFALSLGKKVSEIQRLSNLYFLVREISNKPECLQAFDTHLLRIEKLLNIYIKSTQGLTRYHDPAVGLWDDLFSLIQNYLKNDYAFVCSNK
jgi:hypothetical protein